ncbi:DNA repair protein RecN [Prolixibacteraceae bacterium Z1-6]|uniref:DNA repair protein RecN n=1 Tax=Draconibacterium aestuarii TaxID=2998507 RepID=A0A9X3FB52_9BACT|nr:DNA repair protein RecN [Prolixibacteraceae bacterium Z1-6]
MLSKLSISNYALIHELQVDFHRNLNSVTGETGAGKSIILGALGLILGNRADLSVLKNKDEKCIVEGQFEVNNYSLNTFFEEQDLDYDPSTILRREITPAGKSRAFINDTPVNLKVLRELGLKLIDIHSQHQNLELSNQKFQLNLVDSVAGVESVITDYKKLYTEYKNQQKLVAEIKEKAEKAKTDLDYFQFQFNQLEEAKLAKYEQDELELELEKLTHAEDIKTAFSEAGQLLDSETISVIQNIREAQKAMEKIKDFDPDAADLSERLQSTVLELKDIVDEAEILAERIEFNPTRIEEVNDRLNLLFGLQQKHNVGSVAELIELRNDFDEKINRAVGYENEIKELEDQLIKRKTELETKAKQLSKLRKSAFPVIEKSVVEDLKQMGMTKSRIQIVHTALEDFHADGKDSVSLLFSANPDSSPDEISKIASGGEMSRLMLAIKNLLRSSKALPTVIFDEIDSGVSGEIAVKMGNIIKAFSTSTQIINITHLPQIAAKGDVHLQVYKMENNGKTFTSIKQLNEAERVEELAKMVGGEKLTETAMKAAQELLQN